MDFVSQIVCGPCDRTAFQLLENQSTDFHPETRDRGRVGLRSLISIVGSILVSTAGGVKLSVIYLTFYLLPAQMRGFEIIEKVYY